MVEEFNGRLTIEDALIQAASRTGRWSGLLELTGCEPDDCRTIETWICFECVRVQLLTNLCRNVLLSYHYATSTESEHCYTGTSRSKLTHKERTHSDGCEIHQLG